jgi:hypothetical protein
MLGALTGLPQKRQEYTLVQFTKATAYVHPGHVHYRFRGASLEVRDKNGHAGS